MIHPRLLLAAFPALLAAGLSCSSGVRGVPRNLPVINIHDTPRTPSHGMSKKDYPFHPDTGDYITAWAAVGEAAATERDIERWSSSHGGTISKKQPSPVRKAPSKSSSKGGSTTYTIKPGDTLGGIAAKHKTTVAKIKAANGLKSDLIRAGKTLRIPR
ncbi:MAG TPA: LysM peptidoglycan-binding domain-containing protein [Prosthecobacter sp.]|nr:LysM peptidoglycan-binding domain-containing protein [Prosthecobacter sp.]HRK16847.1 LysM peptidoglycan-binding domain-containing protein [Prosthecobacter sp.]